MYRGIGVLADTRAPSPVSVESVCTGGSESWLTRVPRPLSLQTLAAGGDGAVADGAYQLPGGSRGLPDAASAHRGDRTQLPGLRDGLRLR